MNGQTIEFCSKTQKAITTRKFYNFFLNDSGGDSDKTFVQTRKEKGKNCYSAMLALLVGSLMAIHDSWHLHYYTISLAEYLRHFYI